jgi:hypothetical protein
MRRGGIAKLPELLRQRNIRRDEARGQPSRLEAAFPANGSSRAARRAVVQHWRRARRKAALHFFDPTNQLHRNILQSGATIDSWRGWRADLAVCAQGRRLDECDLFGID